MGGRLKTRQPRRLRAFTLILGSCLALYCFFFAFRPARPTNPGRLTPAGTFFPTDLLNNLSLSEEQCNSTFPGLTKEIDGAVALGPFQLKQTGTAGHLQGKIENGRLHIIHAQRRVDLSREMLNSRAASLHQIHRALLTSPAPLPDTYFALNFQDESFGTAWTYSRAADPEFRSQEAKKKARDFLIPHFSFWAWPLPFIGSMYRAAGAIAEIEVALPFYKKIPKAVWRGTAWFNSVHNPRLRQNLLREAKGKDWADVEALDWKGGGSRDAVNALPIEDFCRYKYVLHTEGVAYSGRFQFLQMCASVVITPPIQWLQHTTHLVKPLFSSSLDLDFPADNPAVQRHASGADSAAQAASASKPEHKQGGWKPSERVRRSWPVQYPADEANIVFVAPDWSDLGATVAWLEAHPAVAEGIARRQRELFVGGGYFSPAAEMCYWRALVRGWAEVVRTEGMGWEDTKGVTFEEFSLTNGE